MVVAQLRGAKFRTLVLFSGELVYTPDFGYNHIAFQSLTDVMQYFGYIKNIDYLKALNKYGRKLLNMKKGLNK